MMCNILEFPTDFEGIWEEQDAPSSLDENVEHIHPRCAILYWVAAEEEYLVGGDAWKTSFFLRNGNTVILLKNNYNIETEYYIHAEEKVGGPFTESQIDALLVILNRGKE